MAFDTTIGVTRNCYSNVTFSTLVSVSVTKVTNLIVISALCLCYTTRSSSVSTVSHGIITLICVSLYIKFMKFTVKLNVSLLIGITAPWHLHSLLESLQITNIIHGN